MDMYRRRRLVSMMMRTDYAQGKFLDDGAFPSLVA